MSSNFEMSDLGLLTYYVGIEVIQHKEGIILKYYIFRQKTQACLFCGEPEDTRDNLYFACPYTFWIEVVGNLFGEAPDPDWETTLGSHLEQLIVYHPFSCV